MVSVTRERATEAARVLEENMPKLVAALSVNFPDDNFAVEIATLCSYAKEAKPKSIRNAWGKIGIARVIPGGTA